MTELTHFGVKGMKWGVRKKTEYTPEQQARREQLKNATKNVAMGAAILAGAGITAYAGHYEATNLKNAKEGTAPDNEWGSNLIKNKMSVMQDETIPKGQDYVRRSNVRETHAADRTYVVAGEEQPWQFLFGEHQVNLKGTRDLQVPGLRTQLDILADEYGAVDRKELRDTYASKGILAKRYIDKFSDDQVATRRLGELTNNWWKGDKANDYISQLQRRGYSAVQDINYADMNAKIVFDANSLIVDNVVMNVDDED